MVTLTPAHKRRITLVARGAGFDRSLAERLLHTHIRLGRLPDDWAAVKTYADSKYPRFNTKENRNA